MKRDRRDYTESGTSAVAIGTTPGVLLLSGLLDRRDYDRAKQVIEGLKPRAATQPAYAAVVEHFSKLIADATAAK